MKGFPVCHLNRLWRDVLGYREAMSRGTRDNRGVNQRKECDVCWAVESYSDRKQQDHPRHLKVEDHRISCVTFVDFFSQNRKENAVGFCLILGRGSSKDSPKTRGSRWSRCRVDRRLLEGLLSLSLVLSRENLKWGPHLGCCGVLRRWRA